MGIIIKFTLKNIWEKKFRTLLILFSICLSTALTFSSLGISDNVAQVYLNQIRSQTGDAEITIYADADSPTRYFRSNRAEIYQGNLDYVVGTISETGIYKITPNEQVRVNLLGYKLEDLQMMNPLTIEQEYGLYPFKGRKIIISRLTAEQYGLEAGDNLDIKINGSLQRFTISAIGAPDGLLTPGTDSFNGIVPRENLASTVGEKGKISQLFLKSSNPELIDQVVEDLSKQYSRYEVSKTLTAQELKQYTDIIRMPFMLMLLLVILISIFVIYTSFKVIVIERMPIMGTFRSIGATKKMTGWLLLGESTVYGVIGGILGCLLGTGILYMMTYSLASTPWQTTPPDVQLTYDSIYLLISFAGAVILSFTSSFIPIRRVSRIPLRDIILYTYNTVGTEKNTKTIPALLMLGAAMLLPLLVPDKIALILSVSSIILATIAITWLLPVITHLFVLFFERYFPYIFGNEGILAVKNIRGNKEILNNISLLTIGLASLLLINTISFSVSHEVVNAYDDFKFDIWTYLPRADRSVEYQIRSVKGVESALGLYQTGQVELANRADKISVLYGIDGNKIPDYLGFELLGNEEKMLEQFSSGRSIITTTFLQEKYALHEGDIMTLMSEKGYKDYQVVGFARTLLNNGNMMIIPDKYMKQDWKFKYYSNIWIKSSTDPENANLLLKDKFARQGIWSTTMAEMEENNQTANSQLFAMLQGFSMITMIIGIFGVFNNFMVSLLSRKRSLAVFRSIGMSQKQMVKVLLTEALACGLIAGITGSLGGIVYVILCESIMFSINIPITMQYSTSMFITAIIAGALISMIASLGPSRQTSKLDIVEALKYE